VINASPFDLEKQASRLSVLRERALELALPIVYLNSVGGQDELVFDGGSMVVAADGQVTQHLPAFETALATVTFNAGKLTSQPLAPALSQEASVYQALTLGLADYVAKNRFPGVVLGLSGGVDSALTLAIAVDALGADKVHAVLMPSEFTANISVDDAIDMTKRLGVKYSILPISTLFEGFKATLAPEFAGLPFDTTEENLQARIRGMLLMALSNKFGSMVLTTGNKSEMAVGYCTLYGDMAGGFALLKDVFKTLVYRLCAYRNGLSPVIPERIITRPPSAELRADQTDQDSLPDYAVLDAIVAAYVEQDLGRADILAMGFTPADVTRVLKLIDSNEYKRRQSPVGVRISHKNFGKDRRYPITAKLDF
jgi:NAD+ synthase (glutamine-hydrolysing)